MSNDGVTFATRVDSRAASRRRRRGDRDGPDVFQRLEIEEATTHAIVRWRKKDAVPRTGVMISYVCLFLIMPAGVSRRAAVGAALDGVVWVALHQRRRWVVSFAI